MRDRVEVTVGAILLSLGLLLLVDVLVEINLWAYLGPLILIGVGIWLVLRPTAIGRRGGSAVRLLGDLRRRGNWVVRDQDFWCIVGDVRLDLTTARIPPGETTLKIQGFVGDVIITLPEGVGIAVASTAAVTSARVFGYNQDYIFSAYEMESPGYQDADQRIRLELLYFVVDLRIRRAPGPERPDTPS